MTPYEIDVLLHYYGHVDDHPDIVRNPPVWAPTIDAFLMAGLLRQSRSTDTVREGAYVIDERGKAYVEALERVPLPVQVWVIPEHKR